MSAVVLPFRRPPAHPIRALAAPSVSVAELQAALAWAEAQGADWHVEAIHLADAEIALGVAPPRGRPMRAGQGWRLFWIIVRDEEGAVLVHAENSSGAVLPSVMAALDAVLELEAEPLAAAIA
ncbi:hypothetical protein [Teichococcus oryzae]|uniref:Uncharacterized protein n=1 Tax=Teichococcus oryzae TaxID=1608942 RepID=A0A5B2TJK3_9PROT|nr:hypothetical protein [Pseudoroseomonas oryzae]KAA2214273.1 hypothetical protein F0Q34_00630 [Pseudoroseomonas oryzae]